MWKTSGYFELSLRERRGLTVSAALSKMADNGSRWATSRVRAQLWAAARFVPMYLPLDSGLRP